MKHLLIIILSVLLSPSLYAQVNNNSNTQTIPSEEKLSYNNNKPHQYSLKNSNEWKTYKILKITGLSSLGIGIPITFYGIIGLGLSLNDGGDGTPFTAIIATGGTLMLSSIPLLIIANHYKKKALMNNLALGLINLETPNHMGNLNFTPAISLALKF